MRPFRTAFTLAALAAAFPAFAQAPLVTAVSPARESLSALPTTTVEVTFDRALDPASVSTATVRVFGNWTGLKTTGTFQLSDGNRTLRFTPDERFQSGERVMVQLSRGLRAADGTPLERAYAWHFWTRALSGGLDQTEVSRISVRRPGEGNTVAYGAYAGDLDGDGYGDLAVVNEATNDLRVFRNDGAGHYPTTFEVVPVPNGSVPSPNEGGDFNNDGHIDIAVANTTNDRLSVLLGDGAGHFPTGASYAAGQAVRGVGALDLDGDGDDDLVTAHRQGNDVGLFLNNGNGTFAAVQRMEGQASSEYGIAVADANRDGLLDVFVGSFNTSEVVLLLGNGTGGLTYAARRAVGGNPWQLAVGDIDNDGDVDVASAGSYAHNFTVSWGDGAGGFSGANTFPTGNFVVAIDLGDLDGDGDLDVVTSNYASRDLRVHENLGGGQFGNVRRLNVVGNGSCATLHDRDNDGDLDITGIDEGADMVYLYLNPGTPTNNPDPIPEENDLLVGGPNPFRDQTTLRVELAEPRTTSLRIYDVLGREVAALIDGRRLAEGTHTFTWDARAVPPGLYIAQLRVSTSVLERKLMVVR
ncbi:MAG TPA: FG-GAP-like repeat-containing protein [Rubricoccaceae bacterium]|nr:FG-GAP-like repeat-containing protein [Rubricoccaceae bacterium]